jgi:hypothetical protein
MSTTPQMTTTEKLLIETVIRHEAEFGRELPSSSFYKSVALGIMRKYGVRVQ